MSSGTQQCRVARRGRGRGGDCRTLPSTIVTAKRYPLLYHVPAQLKESATHHVSGTPVTTTQSGMLNRLSRLFASSPSRSKAFRYSCTDRILLNGDFPSLRRTCAVALEFVFAGTVCLPLRWDVLYAMRVHGRNCSSRRRLSKLAVTERHSSPGTELRSIASSVKLAGIPVKVSLSSIRFHRRTDSRVLGHFAFQEIKKGRHIRR